MATDNYERIQTLFEEVQSGLQELHNELGEVNRKIDSEQYISAETINNLEEVLIHYKQQSIALEAAGAELSIPIGDSIAEIATAIQSYKSKQYEDQLRALVLDYFRLSAEAADVCKVLEESKQKLIEKCKTSDDDLGKALAPYGLVVEHVRYENNNRLSDDNYDLIEKEISRSVARATDRGDLLYDKDLDITDYLEGSTDILLPEKENEKTSPRSNSTENGADNEPNEPIETQPEEQLPDKIKTPSEEYSGDSIGNTDTLIENNSTEESASNGETFTDAEGEPDTESSEAHSHTEDLDSTVDETSDEPVELSDFAKAAVEHGVLLERDDTIGELTVESSPAEDKKVTTSIFLSDMRKGMEKPEKAILKLLNDDRYVSPETIAISEGMPRELAESTLEYLFRKGYVRKYSLASGGYFYAPSPKLEKAMEYKDASKYAGIRQRREYDSGALIEDRASSAATRIALMVTKAQGVTHMHDLGVRGYQVSTSLTDNCFVAELNSPEIENGRDLMFGTVWYDTKECDHLCEALDQMIQKSQKIDRLCVAGISEEKARALAETFLSYFTVSVEHSSIELYSVLEEKFVPYSSENSVTKDEDSPDHTERKPTVSAQLDMDEFQQASPISVSSLSENPESKKDAAGKEQELTATSEERIADTKLTDTPQKADLRLQTVYEMLANKKFYAASASLKAYSNENPDTEKLYTLIAYALNDPMGHCVYSTDAIYNLIGSESPIEEDMVVAAAIRTFFLNHVPYDYNLKPFYTSIKEYSVLSRFPNLSKILHTLMTFKDRHNKGMDAYAGYRARDISALEKSFLALHRDAQNFYDNYVVAQKKESTKQRRFIETKKLIFDVNSELGIYIKSVVDDERECLPLLEEFLKEQFFKDGYAISSDTVDGEKMDRYIDRYWDRAGDAMVLKKNEELKSHLRNNIISLTTKAVQLLARWHELLNLAGPHLEDEGAVDYKKSYKQMLDNITKAVTNIEKAFVSTDTSLETKAGLSVLSYTLRELRACLDGTYSEYGHMYYYIDFLLTDDVVLTKEYLPDLDMHSSTMQSLMPSKRILQHLQKCTVSNITFEDRLKEILEEQGDDYGSAHLIYDYLVNIGNAKNIQATEALIDSGINYAKETADLRKEDFIGELELAQSYGQIDNSEENKKDKILQIVSLWYDWAVESANYGFFKKVMDAYLLEIRESAKKREKSLLDQLEKLKKTDINSISVETKKKRTDRIAEMIREQNYTVAEDLLARATRVEDESQDIIEEDFLKDFLDNYDDYYKQVSLANQTFTSLVSARTRNKEQRGARRLAENWLPGGGNIGTNRLQSLLTDLGFKVKSVTSQERIGKFEHYLVTTADSKGANRYNYTHPIAALGSGAARDGFRVVCLNGNYTADKLIDVMKEIGNAKHTVILVDCALTKSERRRLARKTKNTLGDKFFGVIDRTVMWFLVRNFDETKINRMLVSLIAPFAYYQPYVWESANVMPPEIFMGRKNELEQIKSSTGVNIVYGGRQLGKSALLRKAKADIDHDENNDRALYVDIKGLNYLTAAQKVAHELYDHHILKEDRDITDWDELAREIKNRLRATDEERIPYLLLLLDEADAFIESCESVNYKPLDALKDIQNISEAQFKFVVAGLRNVIRFKREAALSNNSVLTHLRSMTVQPFNTLEARELMEVPLHYLGLRFPKEKEFLVTLILATTNYFPGLIQMYCAKLLDSMRSNDYAGYNEANTPVYEVSEEHIKRVLADPDFMQQIREKFIITLKLDEDNYYYLIALLMAYLYHKNGYSSGYSPEDIRMCGTELDVGKISGMDDIRLSALMDELCDLNVLKKTDDTHYLFTRFTFFQTMGTSVEVENKLLDYMEV